MIEKQLQRRSQRNLKNQPLSSFEIEQLRLVANSAPTSINGHSISSIFITDRELVTKISEWNWNQEHIKKAPLFILFLIDLKKLEYAFKKNDISINLDDDIVFNVLMNVGLVDAAIEAQSISDAALSMNMGTCYIGGVRTFQEKIIKEMNLPERVIPVLGLTVGYIESQEELKPKMDTTFDNIYSEEEMKRRVDQYDDVMLNYYGLRNNGKNDTTWSSNTAKIYDNWFNKNNLFKSQKELMDKKYKL